jgi:hypothetical protein
VCQRNHRTRRKRKQKSSLPFSSLHPTRTSARAVKRLTSMDDTSSSSHILLVTVDRPACHHLSKDLLLTRLIHNAPQAHRAGSSRCSGPPALGHRVRTGGKELPVTHCSLSFLASTRIVLRIDLHTRSGTEGAAPPLPRKCQSGAPGTRRPAHVRTESFRY